MIKIKTKTLSIKTKRHIFLLPFLLCATFIVTGCAASSGKNGTDTGEAEPSQAETAQAESDIISIGKHLKIEKPGSGLTLLDNKDVLASDGLYYAAWVTGSASPYRNSDGETVDLYDAQLYLLLGEFTDNGYAVSNQDSWLAAARNNYEITQEDTIDCDGISYTVLTYNCINEENPYARGVSAFGVYENIAVCIELTCQETFQEELSPILTDFLNHCTYVSE